VQDLVLLAWALPQARLPASQQHPPASEVSTTSSTNIRTHRLLPQAACLRLHLHLARRLLRLHPATSRPLLPLALSVNLRYHGLLQLTADTVNGSGCGILLTVNVQGSLDLGRSYGLSAGQKEREGGGVFLDYLETTTDGRTYTARFSVWPTDDVQPIYVLRPRMRSMD